MQIKSLALFGIAALVLAGCGETLGQQALFGAGAGATGAVLLEGDLATGTVLGALGNVAYCQTYPERC